MNKSTGGGRVSMMQGGGGSQSFQDDGFGDGLN